VLSFFIAADTIAPDVSDPKGRNRYSYVLGNPIRYIDPSGHCADPAGRAGACKTMKEELAKLGFELDESCPDCLVFTFEDLDAILEGIHRLMAAAGWKTADQFKAAVLTDAMPIKLQSRQKSNCSATNANCTVKNADGTSTIQFVNLKDRHLKDTNARLNIAKTTVHELAHAWDNNYDNKMSKLMAQETGAHARSDNGRRLPPKAGTGEPVDEYGGSSPAEDWATSVEAVVFYGEPRIVPPPHYSPGVYRDTFVKQQFKVPGTLPGTRPPRYDRFN
jgi:hypothetical protein